MARAYLSIDVETGKEKAVRDALRRIAQVKRADLVTGRHDIIAIVEGTSIEALLTAVLRKVRTIKGIRRTSTHLVVE